MKQYCEFHQLLSGKSPSRLPMSSKSNPGVMEDRLVPDTIDFGVNFLEMYSKHILKVSFNSDMHNTFKTINIEALAPKFAPICAVFTSLFP